MVRKIVAGAGLVLALLCGPAAGQDSDELRTLINKLMQRAVITVIMDVQAPDKFVADNDPNTLQIVYITGPLPERVSDDGEVVFMHQDLNINDQNVLTYEAFRRKAKRILAGS